MLLSFVLALNVAAAEPAPAPPKRVEPDEVAAPTTVRELDTVYCVRFRRHAHTRTAPVCRQLWEWRAIKDSTVDHSADFFPAGSAFNPTGDLLAESGGIVVSTALLEEASVGRARHLSIKRLRERRQRELEIQAARRLVTDVDAQSKR